MTPKLIHFFRKPNKEEKKFARIIIFLFYEQVFKSNRV